LPLRRLRPHPRRDQGRGAQPGRLIGAVTCKAFAPPRAARSRRHRLSRATAAHRRGAAGHIGIGVRANAFIRVGVDDTVAVLAKHIEFGQGTFTGLATLVAEEMDADWSTVRAVHAPADVERYRNLMRPFQMTGGSNSIANAWEQMRKAGATARAMLVAAAAEAWQVPADSIVVENGVLRHASGRSARFGALARAASRQPAPADVALKDPASFRLIGRDGAVSRLDSVAKSNGTAQYTIDIRAPRLLTVVVARAPRFGARVASFDPGAAAALPGVVSVRQIPTGVAVYADSTWPALKGRAALRIVWDETAAETRGSEELVTAYRALASRPGQPIAAHGDVDAALVGAERVVEAEYVFPYLAHAPMEPLDGVLDWDGTRAVARFGCQVHTPDHHRLAGALGLPPAQVEIDTMLAGGSFGLRAQPDSQFVVELAEVAKAIGPGRPVKLVSTREDDIRGGYYRPLYLHRLRGAVRDGAIIAWSDTIVGQSLLRGTSAEAMVSERELDRPTFEGADRLPYDIAHFRCDLHTTRIGVPVLWWRSVGSSHTGYAVECFIDLLLQEAGLDPVAGRLALMGKAPRMAGALRAAAEFAGWSGPGPLGGRARGVAVVECFGTAVAQIAEVSLGDEAPRVHKVWCAVDRGIAVNPDVVRAQMEGGIGFGLGHALFAEVDVVAGRPMPGNFDTYRSLRLHEMPEIEVAVIRSSEPPTGVGEPGVPPIAPAVANAMARLGVARPRRLPFVRAAA
jgi:isoquinoline 1-oxidoreductase beta subunit